MAWNGDDSEYREKMRMALSKCREAVYAPLRDLEEAASHLVHPEKGPTLRSQVTALGDDIRNRMDFIEKQLNR